MGLRSPSGQRRSIDAVPAHRVATLLALVSSASLRLRTQRMDPLIRMNDEGSPPCLLQLITEDDAANMRAATELIVDGFNMVQRPFIKLPGWEERAREKVISEEIPVRKTKIQQGEKYAWIVALQKEEGCLSQRDGHTLLGTCELGLIQTPSRVLDYLDLQRYAMGFLAKEAPAEPEAETQFLWVVNVVVTRNMRRKGIAKELMLAAERYAIEFGYDRLYLKVDRKNMVARRLYEALGYRMVFYSAKLNRLRLPSSAEICMRKDLSLSP